MDIVPLPEEPSLEQLRNQAKDRRDASGVPLWQAQLAVARQYGFSSWARLKRHVGIVVRYSRFPDRVSTDNTADTFLRLACLNYADDGPARWAQAGQILGGSPDIAEGSIHVAAATADAGELRRILAADPVAARREGGPFRWEPLSYLAYARHDPQIPASATLDAARVLLAAGADPNGWARYFGQDALVALLEPITS